MIDYQKLYENRKLFDLFNFGILILDDDLEVKYWNNWLSFFTQIDSSKVEGKFLTDVFDSIEENKLKRSIKACKSIGSSLYFNSKQGYFFPIKLEEITNPIYEYMQQEVTIYPLDKTHILITIFDKTSLKEAKSKVKEFDKLLEQQKKLVIDRLTGLPNRNQLILDVENDKYKKLAIINIDGFTDINDFYGFEVGDLYLKFVAEKFSENIKCEKYKFYKSVSDEYAILCDDESVNDEEFINNVKETLENVQSNFFKYENYDLVILLSAGIAFGKDKIFEKADMALKKAKKSKKLYTVLDENMLEEQNLDIQQKHFWVNKLLEALKDDRIKLYYQPIYDLKSDDNKIEKYECLIRKISKEGDVIAPFFFLDVAKQAKVYNEITKRVIIQSFETFKNNNYIFSINFSEADIKNTQTMELLFDKLKENPQIGKRLVIELLETEEIDNFKLVSDFIEKVNEYGVKIAIDDFGTGYSNFSYLLKLKIDFLKIDASLIKNIYTDENSKKIVETLIDFSKKLGSKTIAEFVHNRAVFDEVKKMGIDYAQGYYVDKPQSTIGNPPVFSE